MGEWGYRTRIIPLLSSMKPAISVGWCSQLGSGYSIVRALICALCDPYTDEEYVLAGVVSWGVVTVQ
jgi:hypothetical protein